MLRAILLASPIVLVAVVSCGDSSSTSFEDITGGSAGTDNSLSGASSGGKSSQAGSSGTAGGTKNTAGNANRGGTKNTAGNANAGGTKNTAGNANAGGTKNTAGTGNNAGTANLGGATNAGAPSDAAGTANGGCSSDCTGAGGGPDVPLCPNVFGTYKIKDKAGTCNGLNKDAPQSIQGTTNLCAAHFVSEPPNGAEGVNGGASIDASGNFTGAMLFLDMTQRNPCSGTWNAQDETLTVKCGGELDLCTVLLELQ
jgi:hypothetical protein